MINPLYKKHLISISDFTKDHLQLILKIAFQLKNKSQPKLLKNKIIAVCFLEASTRTRLSFESAIYRLGASSIGFSDASHTSLAKKGESFIDTILVISKYVDAIILRHPKEGASKLASEHSGGIPVINAGDGSNQHPTQTILDLFSIQDTQGRLNHLEIAIVGDLKYSRTVHSLTQALSKFKNNRIHFIAHQELMLPKYIINILKEKKIEYYFHNEVKDVIKRIDILYMTRIQKERLDVSEYAKIHAKFVLSRKDLFFAKKTLKILHPLPRADEISYEVDSTNHAYYFQQAANGIFVRQAILAVIFNKSF
ncbi:aspartate carbamoyltransferase, catalytic subunit [Wigglesworthia glossinidia endosymbiont of Glossina morsitans morsitans (Yale colony)]|uniref:Aspartate carbamoyltransferase n=1 Tax=Wigglesworthia glossinidia endosymbiont of Glossina morsitans morsitans (Yale colony) TaxID=1142511 RepID=H6Q5U0_WIGGL|nr:aspartate carbamoyltransferase [Wigglesworthia glossinidia]AFA41136.1 aspartate carbamoyltransferase, catalytic subunit [Wigglesworthia glossinidia endosymbiont of Glossina morsitans morsitans (Yale colony)]